MSVTLTYFDNILLYLSLILEFDVKRKASDPSPVI